MRIVLFIKGARGIASFRRLVSEGRRPVLLVAQNQPDAAWYAEAVELAESEGVPVIAPEDPNAEDAVAALAAARADVFVLAGYGKILRQRVIDLPARMCLNQHGGMLPQQRGSAPLNWALIKGRDEFGISVIQVDKGIDTGPVLSRRQFSIDENAAIADLHALANAAFPDMLMEVLEALEQGRLAPEVQDSAAGAYYPARFPDDGLVLFDQCTAREVHDLVRALSDPYPGVHTWLGGRKVRLLKSRLHVGEYYGTAGRIYRIDGQAVLVCAKDKCLWIEEAVFADTGEPLAAGVRRYDRLATVAQAAEHIFRSMGEGE